jgi:hypothetical protein
MTAISIISIELLFSRNIILLELDDMQYISTILQLNLIRSI